MDDESPASEPEILAMIAGLCAVEPRDELRLAALVALLVDAQDRRQASESAEGRG